MAITVIIPCHNMANTLRDAILSAVNEAAEVIVVNDGSTDDFVGALRGLIREYDHLHVLHTCARAGVCYARNVGIRRAAHDLVFPLDADDTLIPGALAQLEAAYSAGTVVYGDWIEDDHINLRVEEMRAPPPEMLWRKPITRGLLFSREDWEKAGHYDPVFNLGAEDWAFALALAGAGVRFVHIPTPVIRYSITTSGRGFACRNRWRLIQELIRETHGELTSHHS